MPSNPSTEANRDKVLRGEVVKVTDSRLEEMRRICIANEGVGYESYHWHWAAVVNELIERRTVETRAHRSDCYEERMKDAMQDSRGSELEFNTPESERVCKCFAVKASEEFNYD